MRPIAFYPQLAKELGSIEVAIYYQQLYYWSDKGGRNDGFIYKSKEEIEEETTLTRYQQDKCRKVLEDGGWLVTKLIKANGAPTLHYKCLKDVTVSISKKLANGKVRNSLILDKRETRESITETTNRLQTGKTNVLQEPISIVKDVIEKEIKPKKFDPLPVFKIIGKNLGVDHMGWVLNKTERLAAEVLYNRVKGNLDVIKQAVEYVKEQESDDYAYQVFLPSELEKKWYKIKKKKNGN